jgi:ATP-dependent protease ClpP protease subunit
MKTRSFKHISAIEAGSARMEIFGEIDDYTSREFVGELKYLEARGDIKDLVVLVNTPGGVVMSAFSMAASLRETPIAVTMTHVGIAASSGVLLMAAVPKKDRKAYNYARMMLHDPFDPDDENREDEGLKNVVSMYAEFLEDGSEGELGFDEIRSMMSVETWLDVNGMISRGLLLEENVIRTERKIEASDVKGVFNIAAQYLGRETESKSLSDMKNIIELLGLDAESTENQIIAAIKSLQDENEANATKISDLEAKAQEAIDAEAETLVDSAIKDGKFKPEAKDDLLVSAKKDIDGFKAIVNATSPKAAGAARVTAQQKRELDKPEAGQLVDGKIDGKTFREYEKTDPSFLTKLEASDPDSFKAFFEAQYKNDGNS